MWGYIILTGYLVTLALWWLSYWPPFPAPHTVTLPCKAKRQYLVITSKQILFFGFTEKCNMCLRLKRLEVVLLGGFPVHFRKKCIRYLQ